MKLALVVPVHNDAAPLARLLGQARELGIFAQVIVVDDGSDTPVELPEGLPGAELLRHETAQGPGAARNAGLARVGTSHMMFMDSDDALTGELAHLWRDLEGQEFDFTLFRHCDSRAAAGGQWGQMPWDDVHWRAAGMGGRALQEVGAEDAAHLAQTANYPWNKIYRTDFLREAQITFPDVPLHEDVLPHWRSFLHAGRILASDRIGAVHYVRDDGARMTNKRDAARLAAFPGFIELRDELASLPEAAPLARAYAVFMDGLCDWISHRIPEEALPELARLRAELLPAGAEA